MPSSSKAQHNFFNAVKHNKGFAKKAGVKQSVARDFIVADKAKGAAAMKRLPDRAAPKRTIVAGGY